MQAQHSSCSRPSCAIKCKSLIRKSLLRETRVVGKEPQLHQRRMVQHNSKCSTCLRTRIICTQIILELQRQAMVPIITHWPIYSAHQHFIVPAAVTALVAIRPIQPVKKPSKATTSLRKTTATSTSSQRRLQLKLRAS